jgi:hypothetical protein
MGLKKRGKYWYGEDVADLRTELARYAARNEYPIDNFSDVRCTCGSDTFYFLTDEAAGVAVRICETCDHEHLMGDSADFADEADVAQHVCVCGEDVFQLVAGVHRYRNQDDSLSDDVRWLYGLVGCYADWKDEYNGYEQLLAAM